MWRFIYFVIALSLPCFAQEEKNAKNNITICEAPEATDAADKVFSCVDIEVSNAVKEENKNCATWLPRTILDYVKAADDSCYNGTVGPDRDAVQFYNFLQYSLKIARFKDFIKSGGAKCINSVKGKIDKCVQEEIGRVKGADNKYHILWRKTKLTIDTTKSCKEANRIKFCVLKELSSDYNCKYEVNNELYVSSLFDYMLKECTKRNPHWLNKRKGQEHPQIKNDNGITHGLLGFLLTLALVGILYVVIRDCRAPNGRWKSISEQFPMRKRQTSLVNSECNAN